MANFVCPCCGHEFVNNDWTYCEETGHFHFYCSDCDFEGTENEVVTKE